MDNFLLTVVSDCGCARSKRCHEIQGHRKIAKKSYHCVNYKKNASRMTKSSNVMSKCVLLDLELYDLFECSFCTSEILHVDFSSKS